MNTNSNIDSNTTRSGGTGASNVVLTMLACVSAAGAAFLLAMTLAGSVLG